MFQKKIGPGHGKHVGIREKWTIHHHDEGLGPELMTGLGGWVEDKLKRGWVDSSWKIKLKMRGTLRMWRRTLSKSISESMVLKRLIQVRYFQLETWIQLNLNSTWKLPSDEVKDGMLVFGNSMFVKEIFLFNFIRVEISLSFHEIFK